MFGFVFWKKLENYSKRTFVTDFVKFMLMNEKKFNEMKLWAKISNFKLDKS